MSREITVRRRGVGEERQDPSGFSRGNSVQSTPNSSFRAKESRNESIEIALEEDFRLRSPPSYLSAKEEFNARSDPPTSEDNYIEYRRKRLKESERRDGNKEYSAIRFSKELEVYTKQSPKNSQGTPSILRKKANGRKVSQKLPKRRKDTLLEKIKRLSQHDADKDGQIRLLLDSPRRSDSMQPVPPRQDWNIASLFPSSKESSQNGQEKVIGSEKSIRGGTPLRDVKNERNSSSEYLLKKYAGNASSPLANKDRLKNNIEELHISPSSSLGDIDVDIPSTPKGKEIRSQKHFSDSKIYENAATRRKKRDIRKLSYLQLEEVKTNDENISPKRLSFFKKGSRTKGGYFEGRFSERVPSDGSEASITSTDELLNQKNTSEASEYDLELSRFDWNAEEVESNSVHKHFDWDKYESGSNFQDEDFQSHHVAPPKKTKTAWVAGGILGIILIFFASGITTYFLTKGDRWMGKASTPTNYFGMEKCVLRGQNETNSESDRYNAIREHVLLHSVGNSSMVDDLDTPQRKALCWISSYDPYTVDVNEGNGEEIMQRYSLAVLYFSTVDGEENPEDNSGSLRNSNFLSDKHECEWDGILCNHFLTVSILRLSNYFLAGYLPLEIGNLKALHFIDLSLNQLTGTLPTTLQQLTSLEYLSLAFNDFHTVIPTFIGQMTSLKSLNLRSSDVIDQIPTNLGNLSNLESLLLDGNSLTGTIPSELGNLYHAEQMNFRTNQLSGIITEELCDLRDIGDLKELVVDERIGCDCCT
eukprot:CAMPEP_0172387318 /NCGR_PEP_ID=MMETSP1061-20121228/4634_1 /TAXON_ID=37318 /ORGANISM="Pseudo-nitzschia pungens, Strain cf. pungens" /LENGTH=759 /DNA_ID=CAMNT_0013116911 /DNA_START=34 /DNA_END=2313 /DNA_ORIENTATION=-